jgi:hypothetical protein
LALADVDYRIYPKTFEWLAWHVTSYQTPVTVKHIYRINSCYAVEIFCAFEQIDEKRGYLAARISPLGELTCVVPPITVSHMSSEKKGAQMRILFTYATLTKHGNVVWNDESADPIEDKQYVENRLRDYARHLNVLGSLSDDHNAVVNSELKLKEQFRFWKGDQTFHDKQHCLVIHEGQVAQTASMIEREMAVRAAAEQDRAAAAGRAQCGESAAKVL